MIWHLNEFSIFFFLLINFSLYVLFSVLFFSMINNIYAFTILNDLNGFCSLIVQFI